MLVLSRREDQKVIFPNLGISVEIVNVKGKNVRLGIDAPRSIRILRGELVNHSGGEDSKAAFQHLAKRIESMNLTNRHTVRNHLNTASLAVHCAQKMLDRDDRKQIDKHLTDAFDALRKLNEMLAQVPGETVKRKDVLDDHSTTNESKEQLYQQGKRWSALVVEDNDNERELLAGVLRMSGFEVVAVRDGLAAIEHLKNNDQPDVVLMDMNMPRMNGSQAIDKIRNDMHKEALPIFAVSGLTREESKLPNGDRGVTGWFSKPVNPNQLVKRLIHEIQTSVN